MATSGTYTNRTTRNDIINAALRLVGAVDPENTAGATTTQITNAAQALNLMTKSLPEALQIFARKYAVVFPQYSQGIYVLGASDGPGGDHACFSNPLGAGYVQTTLSAAAASGASSISVTSATSGIDTVGSTGVTITDTYYIGIELDSGSVQWTTVSGAPSGTTVTLAATLTGAASSGNQVFCYQTKLVAPQRINQAFIRQLDSGNDREVRCLSKDEYNRLGLKSTTGSPVHIYYDHRNTNGHLYVYPEFTSASDLLVIEAQSKLQDFSASGDDYDLPQEFGEYLKYHLAVRIAPEYEVATTKFKQLQELAVLASDIVKGYDQEYPSSFRITPAAQWR